MCRLHERYLTKSPEWRNWNHSSENVCMITSWLIIMRYLLYRRRKIYSHCGKHISVFLAPQSDLPNLIIIGWVLTWATQWVQHVERDLCALQEHLDSPPFFWLCSCCPVFSSLFFVSNNVWVIFSNFDLDISVSTVLIVTNLSFMINNNKQTKVKTMFVLMYYY